MPTEEERLRHDTSLPEAILELVRELREARKAREQDLPSKHDLRAMETRLIIAIQGASSVELKKLADELQASSGPLKAAVAANQPPKP